MKRRDTGILGEKLAGEFLEKRNYRILETNYRCPEGEIDIIALHGDTLVFIEVRTRKSPDFGSPEESITPLKKSRLITVAAQYCQTHDNLPASQRIDFVAVRLKKNGQLANIKHIENAVCES